jgi:hypothetical protein
MRSELDYGKAMYETLQKISKQLARLSGEERVDARDFMASLEASEKEKFVTAIISEASLEEVLTLAEEFEPAKRAQRENEHYKRYKES